MQQKHDIWTDYEIFATLTYPRNESKRDLWLRSTEDANRFIQKLVRDNAHSYLEYFRAIEPHKDGYPHIHFHIRFGTDFKIRDRHIYLYDYIRDNLIKRAHEIGFGVVDFQCPKFHGAGTLGYVTKYIGKSTSVSRLWQLILNPTFATLDLPSSDGYLEKRPAGTNIWKLISVPILFSLERSEFKWKRIKLASWSRGYANTFKHKV